MAAVLACGPDAVLSHRSAAALWRIQPRWPARIDVTAPSRRRHPNLRIHHSPDAESTMHHGIPVTTPARTLLDLADVLDDRALTRALNEAQVLRLTAPAHLTTFLTSHPGRRTSRLARELSATATRSHLEDDFLRFLRRHRLPIPELNQHIAGHEVDAVWRDRRLVAELDGYAFHHTRHAFEHDRDRDADLLDAGFSTLRITHRRLSRHATKEADRLRHLLTG